MERRARPHPETTPFTAEKVGRWLCEHPDFLREHPDVLAALDLPHDTGDAVSLIERQVRVLRERNDTLAQQLETLIARARENDQIADRVHRFGLRLQSAGDLDALLALVTRSLADELALDAVGLRLPLPAGSERPEFRPEFMEAQESARFLDHWQRLQIRSGGPGRPLCGDREMSPLVVQLFEGRSVKIRSSVLVPIEAGLVRAVLAFGSHDPARFTPEMETTFVVRLADLIQAALVRVLP